MATAGTQDAEKLGRLQKMLPPQHVALCHLSGTRYLVGQLVPKGLLLRTWITVTGRDYKALALPGPEGRTMYAKSEAARPARVDDGITVPAGALASMIEKLRDVQKQTK